MILLKSRVIEIGDACFNVEYLFSFDELRVVNDPVLHTYSKFKYGCKQSTNYLARRLAFSITEKDSELPLDSKVIIYPYLAELSPVQRLAESVVDIVGCCCYPIVGKSPNGLDVNYCGLSTYNERMKLRDQNDIDLPALPIIEGKVVTVIDDCVTTGATVFSIRNKFLKRYNVSPRFVSLLSITSNPANEEWVNGLCLAGCQDDEALSRDYYDNRNMRQFKGTS